MTERDALEPAGEWKLVPVEPTPDMMSAGFAVFEIDNPKQYGDGSEARLAIYRAMLAAAPQPPASSPGELGRRLLSVADFCDKGSREAGMTGSAVAVHIREAVSALTALAMERDELKFLLDEGGQAYRAISDLQAALRGVVDANDALHNALAGNPGDPAEHQEFVAAQRRETAAIEAARALSTQEQGQ